MRAHLGILTLAVLSTVAFAGVLVYRPADRSVAVAVYLVAAGALALQVFLGPMLGRVPVEGEAAIDWAVHPRPVADERPPELERLEREVVLATTSAFDVHFRLRPVLMGIATALRFGLREPAFPPDVWELVRPDRPRPAQHDAPGPTLAEIRRAVEALEALR